MDDKLNKKQLISAYIDGELSSQEKSRAEELILNDSESQAYYKEVTQLSDVLTHWEDDVLSSDLENKLNNSLVKIKEERPTMKSNKRLIMSATSFAVALIVGVFVFQQYIHQNEHGKMQIALDKISPQETIVTPTSIVQIDSKGKKDSSIGFKGEVKKNTPQEAEQIVKLKAIRETTQYEPYFLESEYDVQRFSGKKELGATVAQNGSATVAQKDSATLAPRNEVVRPQVKFMRGQMAGAPVRSMAAANVSTEGFSSRGRESGYQASNYNGQLLGVGGAVTVAERRIVADVYSDESISLDYVQRGNTEEYDRIYENEFMAVTENPLSTFSIDVDTGSYSNMRRFINSNQLPYADAVRIEEMVNYFSYDYPKPKGNDPFSITLNASTCPWNSKHQLVRIGLKGKTLNAATLPPSNLVFLIDVSGSMNSANKLPLLKDAFKMLTNQLSANERVAIIVYAGAAGTVLESTPGNAKQDILEAINNLSAGGSTAGGAGIKLAYQIAKDNFIKKGNNRVILATDGDFNVGTSSTSELTRLIEEKRDEGIFLTVLGFGGGNLKDGRMEQIANKGNGNYYYIDTKMEAKKVLVQELGSTLFTIAKDVKLQIEFNPNQIKAYRLIGYENRMLAKEDFNDDAKDAGELGAGHTVTALYEIVPADSAEVFRDVDELVYQKKDIVKSNDLMTVKLRYKEPDESKSNLIKQSIRTSDLTEKPSADFQFAASVAEFGLVLRNSKFKESASYDHVINAAKEGKGADKYGYRAEFISLVEKARNLDNRAEVNDTPGVIQFK